MEQRYCLELAYVGTNYHGFQSQKNAPTIQAAVENALQIYYRFPLQLTGASRTDAGVHALQNFFHFDTAIIIRPADIYHINSILPADIVMKNVYKVGQDFHARFAAMTRQYRYDIHFTKNPFLQNKSYFFPYKINTARIQEASEIILQTKDFTTFAKRGSDQKNSICNIQLSVWEVKEDGMCYTVRANRFLRGMVRGLTATILAVGRERISRQQFKDIIEAKDNTQADFSVPAHGLYLQEVQYPGGFLKTLEE